MGNVDGTDGPLYRVFSCVSVNSAHDENGHIALEVDDAAAACNLIREAGGKVSREAGPVKGGTTVIAFVEDPDGYKIELIEKHS